MLEPRLIKLEDGSPDLLYTANSKWLIEDKENTYGRDLTLPIVELE